SDFLVRIVAGELHVSAQWQQRHAVFGLARVESEELRPESDREADGPHAQRLAHDQVPELVEEHHHADHERKREQGQTRGLDEAHGGTSLNVHWSGRQQGQVRRRAQKRTKGALKRSASMRSSRPPWPGSSVPLSFAPNARLSIDSERSPRGPSTAAPAPMSAAPQAGSSGSQICRTTSAPAMLPAAPPSAPSHVLLGEMRSYSLRRPKARPAKYANESLSQVTVRVRTIHHSPRGIPRRGTSALSSSPGYAAPRTARPTRRGAFAISDSNKRVSVNATITTALKASSVVGDPGDAC